MKAAVIRAIAMAIVAFLSAPLAHAEPHYCTPATCGDLVPGMPNSVVQEGQPCTSWTHFTFAWGPMGTNMRCMSYDGGNTGRWTAAANLVGVRDVGSPCSSWQIAQGPDGSPLWCFTNGPYKASGDPSHPDGQWSLLLVPPGGG